MRLHGVTPDAVVYGVVLKMYANLGKLESVRSMWREMTAAGVTPNVVHYNTLLYCVCLTRDVHLAHQVWRDMEDSGLVPTIVTFTTLQVWSDGCWSAGVGIGFEL